MNLRTIALLLGTASTLGLAHAATPSLRAGSSHPVVLQDLVAADHADVCWRGLYLRGVGKVEAECAAGEERSLGLCYEPCKPGFSGVGPVCFAGCPKSDPIGAGPICCFSDSDCTNKVIEIGLKLPLDIIRAYHDRDNIEQVIQDIKKTIEDALGFKMPECSDASVSLLLAKQESSVDQVWNVVQAAIQDAAKQLSEQLITAGTNDVCWRNLYLRGVGRFAQVCDSDEERSLGACFKPCHSGFQGEGPLCYAGCPTEEAVGAGPLCCANALECSERAVDLAVKLPYDLIHVYNDRLNPAKVLNDLKEALEDAMKMKLPVCDA